MPPEHSLGRRQVPAPDPSPPSSAGQASADAGNPRLQRLQGTAVSPPASTTGARQGTCHRPLRSRRAQGAWRRRRRKRRGRRRRRGISGRRGAGGAQFSAGKRPARDWYRPGLPTALHRAAPCRAMGSALPPLFLALGRSVSALVLGKSFSPLCEGLSAGAGQWLPRRGAGSACGGAGAEAGGGRPAASGSRVAGPEASVAVAARGARCVRGVFEAG